MKVSELLGTLTAQLGWTADTPLEGVLTGSPEARVTGISTCSMPSVTILRQVVQAGHNVVLCDGHPFYLYDPYWSAQPGLSDMIDAMPQVVAKRKIIEDAGLAIIRIHSAWQGAKPHSAALSLARALDLSPGASAKDQDFVLCDLPATNVAGLARRIRTDGIRLIGDPAWKVARVAVMPGMASPARLGAALRDTAVDTVIAGEVIEWEGGPYMIDVQGAGRNCALLLTGFSVSMDPDATALADWARQAFAGVPVTARHNDGDFIWSVSRAAA